MEDNIQYIKERLDRRTLLEGIAEESAELSKAALKLIRAEGFSNNFTPIEEDEAFNNLLEEIEDVLMAFKVLGVEVKDMNIDNNSKWDRWAKRLKEHE